MSPRPVVPGVVKKGTKKAQTSASSPCLPPPVVESAPVEAKPLRIEQWWCVPARGDAYTAPEVAGLAVSGTVIAHPERGDSPITTSRIVAVEGRVITTRSGSRYELGEPEAAYVEWLRGQGRAFDPERPIVVHQ